MVLNVDASVLTAYYQARTGVGGGAGGGTGGAKPANPTPPWSVSGGTTARTAQQNALVRSVMSGAGFVNENAAKLDAPGATADYRRLFALYQGLSALNGLAQQAAATGVSQFQRDQYAARFAQGMQEIGAYVGKTSFDHFQLAEGVAQASATASVGVKTETDAYVTDPLWSGGINDPVDAFQGPVAFTMTLTKKSGPVTVNFDLSEMGAAPRTIGGVVNYLNGKLTDAGVFTRFAVVRTAGGARTTTANGQTVTLGTSPDSFSLKIAGVTTEQVSLSAPGSAPAVFVGETVGSPAVTTTSATGTVTTTKATTASQILKFSTDPAADATDCATGQVWSQSLGAEVQGARASAVGPDGSLYVLTDVKATADGQPIKGDTDVALKKYDSAGNLVYTRTLGAANDASGYALAVSADGSRVAIGGSVTGRLDGGSGTDPEAADSFVTVFDATGQEVWTQRGAATADDHVTGLAFGSDGTLYVSGDASSAMPGAAAIGSQDGYLQAFKPGASGAAQAYTAAFTQQYGATGLDKASGVVVSGSSVFVAGVEAGHAVVRRYDLQGTGAPTLGAVRDLGDIQGGSLAGIALNADGSIVVAGSTHNGALDVGAVKTSYDGAGQAAFVASLSSDLTPGAGETLTYLNATSDVGASAMTVSGGQVYVTGQQATTPPPGQTSAYDGYAAAIDPATGQVTWRQTFRGADLRAAPGTIAVAATGASVLDRLGLPSGAIDYVGSTQVVANSAVRAGDQFQVQVNGGLAQTVTIAATDTLQDVATKIGRASGFMAQASIVTKNGVSQLQIKPINANARIVLTSGKAGRDALEALGLGEGLITTAPDKNAKDSVRANYSMALSSTLDVSTIDGAKQAQLQLASAMHALQNIYTDMTAPVRSAASSAGSGKVPAYLTAQIANYQQALARLTGTG